MSADQKSGNVARISRIFRETERNQTEEVRQAEISGGRANSTMLTSRNEHVPLRNRAAKNSTATAAVVRGGINNSTVGSVPDSNAAQQKQSSATNKAIVRFSYAAQQSDELELMENDELLVLELVEDGWAKGEILNSPSHPTRKGQVGMYPTNFVSTITPTRPTDTPPMSTISGTTTTTARAVDTQGEKHPENAGIPLSTSAPAQKPANFPVGNDGGGNAAGESSPAIFHTSNLLPSSLKGVNIIGGSGASTIGHSTGGNTRRAAMSTLIGGGTSMAAADEHHHMHHQNVPPVSTPQQQQHSSQHNPPPTSGTTQIPPNTAKPKEFARVLYKYDAANSDELSLAEGAIVTVVSRQCEDDGWFLAELDGRRGLFPDNFVKFLAAEFPSSPLQTSPASQPPPSLPAKPQKFNGAPIPPIQPQHNNSHPPPVASARDSRSTLLTTSINSPDSPPADKMMMGMGGTKTATMDMENNNNSSADMDNLLGTTQSAANTVGNRRSMNITALQRKVFPDGKLLLQPQRPPSYNQAMGGGKATEFNVEPKHSMDGEEGAHKLLIASSSSIVKSRTRIAPTNKRPPSKVNSAAVLANGTNQANAKSTNNIGGTPIDKQSPAILPLSSPSTPSKDPHQLTPFSILLDNTDSIDHHFSTQTLQSAIDQQQQTLLCPIKEPQQNVIGAIPSTTPPSQQRKSHFQQHSPLHPNPSSSSSKPVSPSIVSGPTDPTIFNSAAASMGLLPSNVPSSQWVSRIEFDRFAEECQLKFAEMQSEIRVLHARMESAQYK